MADKDVQSSVKPALRKCRFKDENLLGSSFSNYQQVRIREMKEKTIMKNQFTVLLLLGVCC